MNWSSLRQPHQVAGQTITTQKSHEYATLMVVHFAVIYFSGTWSLAGASDSNSPTESTHILLCLDRIEYQHHSDLMVLRRAQTPTLAACHL